MYRWTSEAVSSGHPDKVADQIADAVLDAYMVIDPLERVACEVTCCKDLILVTGEVSSSKQVDVESIVRGKLAEIGYIGGDTCYDNKTITILNKLNTQSGQIAAAVAKSDGDIGAGDQGIMFGFACDETADYMPLAHNLAFHIINVLENERKMNPFSILLPDAKSQVTVAYDDEGNAMYIDTILVSTQHRDLSHMANLDNDEARLSFLRNYLRYLLDGHLGTFKRYITDQTKFLFNPAGLWTLGGPAADTGLSGRKIVVDNYGADCPIGGGSFSGKDPTKVDRSAAYAARYVAKNVVAAGLAKKCQVQLSYAIGVAEPVSVRIQSFGTSPHSDAALTDLVSESMSLSPRGIIDRFDLRRPIYQASASGGHFGRDGFPWEELTLVGTLTERAGKSTEMPVTFSTVR